jgi:hypothetical protein
MDFHAPKLQATGGTEMVRSPKRQAKNGTEMVRSQKYQAKNGSSMCFHAWKRQANVLAKSSIVDLDV